MIDMMNIDFPINVLRKLKQPPQVVILHRGVDEERDNREKMLPLHEIRRIKANYFYYFGYQLNYGRYCFIYNQMVDIF